MITLIVMSFCCMFMLVMISFVLGFHKGIIGNSVKSGTGHIQIHRTGFQSRLSPEYYLEGSDSLKKILEEENLIQHYAMRIKGLGLLSYTAKAQNFTMIGIQPEAESKISLFYKKKTSTVKGPLIEGEYLTEKDHEEGYPDGDSTKEFRLPGLLIGCKTASKFGINIGSKVVCTIQSLKGEIKQQLLVVRGIFKTLDDTYDRNAAFIHYKTAQKILDYSDKGYFSEIVVLAQDYSQMKPLAQNLRQKLAPETYEIFTWDDLNSTSLGFMKLQKVFLSIYIGILLAIAAVGISITVLMSIFERVIEFGVMRAVGMSNFRLIALILIESEWMAFISCILGGIMAFPSCYYLQNYGLDLSKFAEAASITPITLDATIYADVRFFSVLFCFAILLLLAFVVSLYPAIKASKIRIVEALTFV